MFDPLDPLLTWVSVRLDVVHMPWSVSKLSVLTQEATVSAERTPHGRERRDKESKNCICIFELHVKSHRTRSLVGREVLNVKSST